MKKKLLTVLAGVMAAGAAMTAASGASAYIVCNSDGDCWHVHDRVVMRPGWVRHDDDWYFHRDWDHDTEHHWRAWHEGHGYWRGGVWVPMP